MNAMVIYDNVCYIIKGGRRVTQWWLVSPGWALDIHLQMDDSHG